MTEPQTFDASKKPITQTLKKVLEFNHRDINRTAPTQRNRDSHALASVFVMGLWLMIVVMVPVASTYGIRGDFRMWTWKVFRVVAFRTDVEMIGFIFVLGTVASFLIYHFFFNLAYITKYKDVIDTVHPVSETTTETTTQGDTSVLEYDSNAGYVYNGELQDRHEQAFHLDGMTLTGRNMHTIKLLSSTGKLDRLRRDVYKPDPTMFSWVRDLPDLPKKVTDKKKHYGVWIEALTSGGYVGSSGLFTEKGVSEFLEITPTPPPTNSA